MSDGLQPQIDDGDASGSIDRGQIMRAVRRRRLAIAGATLGAFLLALAFVTLTRPRYTAEAKVLVENQESYLTKPDKASSADSALPPDAEAVQSQLQIIQSRDLARRAIKELNLVGNKEFDPSAGGGGTLGRVMVMLGLARNPVESSPEDRVLDTYFEKLAVLSPVKTRILSIEFSSSDPELAARGANAIADIYIDTQSRAKREAARQIAASLASQNADVKTRLAEAESRAESFRLRSGLLVGANNLTITAQQLADINTQLAMARTQQADAQAKARLIRDMVKQGRVGDVPDVANNDLIRKYSEQLIVFKGQMAEESRTLLPGHPRIKELSAKITDLENSIRVAAGKTVRTLENESRIAGSRVENLHATLESQKKVAGTANADDVTLREYESEAKLLKEQLESNVGKYQEALARQGALSTPADARVISRAVVPALPSFPKKVPILVSATLAGLVVSAGAVVAGELLSGRPDIGGRGRSYAPPAPVAPMPSSAPVLGILHRKKPETEEPEPEAAAAPAAPAEPETVAPPHGTSDLPVHAGAGGGLAEKIGAAGVAGNAVVTLVAGAGPGHSAAAHAVALARALSRARRTILVNLDGAALEAERLVDVATPAGLSELLRGDCSFAEAINRDRMTRLHVLAHGEGAPVEGQEGLDLVLDALCETYDHLVLVAPRPDASRLAADLAPYADFAIVSVAADAPEPELQAARDALSSNGAGEIFVMTGTPAMPRERMGVA